MFRNISYLEILHPSELGIILSYQCNAECKHCLYACGRKWTGWMSVEQLEEALKVLSGWRHDFQIHLTGGEPFMNFPLLLEATKLVKSAGIYQFVETNASWCTSEDRAYDWFGKLSESGLNGILVSCSAFQAESIPLKRVLIAIKSAGEIFGYRNVGVYQVHCIEEVSKFSIDETVPIESYLKRYGPRKTGQMFWDIYGLIDSGRASYTLGYLTQKCPPEKFRSYNCRRELLYAHHSHMDLYGNYISWFCGGLSMGSWRNFDELLDRFLREDYPELIRILIHNGPYGLYRFASDRYGYLALEDGYVGKCHLCVDVRKWLSRQGQFAELQPSQFYDFVDSTDTKLEES